MLKRSALNFQHCTVSSHIIKLVPVKKYIESPLTMTICNFLVLDKTVKINLAL
jgi:hypothetical protein